MSLFLREGKIIIKKVTETKEANGTYDALSILSGEDTKKLLEIESELNGKIALEIFGKTGFLLRIQI